MKHHDLKFLWTSHFQSFIRDNHPKMDFHHKTQKPNVKFLILITDTYVKIRDEIKLKILVSENFLCHILFDLECEGKTRITLFQIILVKVLLMDERKFRPISSTTDIKFLTPIFKILEIHFTSNNTIHNVDRFTMFTNSEDKINNHFHICFI